jgi:hypothetical protein
MDNATLGLANILPNEPLPNARTQEDAYYATHTIGPPRWVVLLAAALRKLRIHPAPVAASHAVAQTA